MKMKTVVLVVFLAAFVLCLASKNASAQLPPKEPELADQIQNLYAAGSDQAHQQEFLSILIFVIFGGASTYAVMRGIRKVITIY